MKNLLLIAITILAVGCGGKNESTTETKSVEEKVLEVKEDAKPEEPVAETKPELEGVNEDEVERREDITYLKGSDTPYTGKVYQLYPNGQKEYETDFWNGKEDGLWMSWHKNGKKQGEGYYKDGKMSGLQLMWHENGQKSSEVNYKDGNLISRKYWNSKGEPVDTWKEAVAE